MKASELGLEALLNVGQRRSKGRILIEGSTYIAEGIENTTCWTVLLFLESKG